jgi:hypothetical protein
MLVAYTRFVDYLDIALEAFMLTAPVVTRTYRSIECTYLDKVVALP